MEIIILFLQNFWNMTNDIALYIIFGVLIAGLLKIYIKQDFIKKALGKKSIFSSIKATLLGIPLPLCSCSVVPFISALKQSGASKSSILSFTISTPITGADSIVATYGIFGWFFTVYRIISSVIISLLAGIFAIFFDKKEKIKFTITPPVQNNQTCCDNNHKSFWVHLYHHAYEEIFKDIAKSLFIGLILAALITTFIPENMGELLSQNIWINYILVLAISTPLYVCATASLPLGVALLATGFSPGAMFIFLSAGPASNAVTISVIQKVLGFKYLILYLSTVILGSLIFGYLLDTMFAPYLDNIYQTLTHNHESYTIVSYIFSAILLLLIFITFLPKKSKQSCCNN